MKDKEKAEEYMWKAPFLRDFDGFIVAREKDIKQAYLAGLAEGRKDTLSKLENGIIRVTDSTDSQETNKFDRVKYLEKLLSISEEINEGLKTKIKEQVKLIETQYVENQTLGNNNAKLLQMYAELKAQIPQWHDLRKNPDDLPEEGIEVLVLYSNTYGDNGLIVNKHTLMYELAQYVNDEYDTTEWYWVESGTDYDIHEVIKWCELPKFEE